MGAKFIPMETSTSEALLKIKSMGKDLSFGSAYAKTKNKKKLSSITDNGGVGYQMVMENIIKLMVNWHLFRGSVCGQIQEWSETWRWI